MIAVAFDHVTITLNGRIVLADVSFAIGSREFIGLLGPNGSGKTTLLRTILGLIRSSRGAISVLGRPVVRGNPAIGYLPQLRGDAVPRLTGRDFLASAAGGHRWGLPLQNQAVRREIDRVLELLDARDLARRAMADLSGGERQRLFLAQALLGRPRLLLLDEPLTSLDPRYQTDVVALAARLRDEFGLAILFSAHELNPLLGVLDRVLYLGNHQAAIGSVDEVITGPILSRLYQKEIEVLRVGGRIFVMAGEHEVERDEHRHVHA